MVRDATPGFNSGLTGRRRRKGTALDGNLGKLFCEDRRPERRDRSSRSRLQGRGPLRDGIESLLNRLILDTGFLEV